MPTPTVLTASGFGRTVALRVAPAAVDAVHAVLPYWWADSSAQAIGAVEKEWTVPSSSSAEAIVSDLELWVAEHAEGLVFVHAGVVAFDGVALVLPGRSFSGKSTLTAELLRAGAQYGSDEYAVLTPEGRVRAYPRPLALRDGGRRRVPASELGASTFEGELPVGGIAVLRYSASDETSIIPISPALAVLRMFDNTVCASSRPTEAFDALVAACAKASAVEGTRNEARNTTETLRSLLRIDHRSV